jgi:hypothetical protein
MSGTKKWKRNELRNLNIRTLCKTSPVEPVAGISADLDLVRAEENYGKYILNT